MYIYIYIERERYRYIHRHICRALRLSGVPDWFAGTRP